MNKIRTPLFILLAALTLSSCSNVLGLKVCTVDFNQNFSGAAALPSQKVILGGLASSPVDPVRAGYAFGDWYREPSCLTAWDFQSDKVVADQVLFAKWTADQPPITGQVYSLEFGHHNDYNYDFCNTMAAPKGGTLFSVWTKVPGTLTYPATAGKIRGNMIVYVLNGDNWSCMALVGNIDAYPPGSAGGAGGIYNANYMINIGGDKCVFYDKTRRPLSVLNDWIWVAWQVVVNSDKSITFRQWLKYGLDGQVFAAGQTTGSNNTPLPKEGEDRAYFGTQPSDAVSFQVGYNNFYDNEQHIPNSYLCHARMEARGTEPSLDYLEGISRLNAPDPSAWADYELSWENGAPNLKDRSGHGRNLSVHSGGTLYQGPLSPAF